MLESAVAKVMHSLSNSSGSVNPYKNVIDPFLASFESAHLSICHDDWFELELHRQQNKTLSNAIGLMHQELLGALPGWENIGTGGYFDVKHKKSFGALARPAIAEVKNKYNTLNAAGAKALHDSFRNVLDLPEYKNYVFYLVQVIQKGYTGDVPWVVPNRGLQENIRVIGADLLYELSTGELDALRKTYIAINKILDAKYGLKLLPIDNDKSLELFDRAYGRFMKE